MRLNKKLILFILATVLGIAGVVTYRYMDSFANLTVIATQDGEMTLYEAGFIDGSDFIVEESALKITNESSERIKKGEYLLVYTDDRHETIRETILLDSDTTVKLKPVLTQESLGNILVNERTNIHTSLSAKYPSIFDAYSIEHEALYLDGSWYGATLIYNDATSSQRDAIRVILRKQDGVWQAYTKPYITINSIDYPSIPRTILEEVNQPSSSDKESYDHPSHAPESHFDQ